MSKPIKLDDYELVPLYEAQVMSEIAPSLVYEPVLTTNPQYEWDDSVKDYSPQIIGYMLKPKAAA